MAVAWDTKVSGGRIRDTYSCLLTSSLIAMKGPWQLVLDYLAGPGVTLAAHSRRFRIFSSREHLGYVKSQCCNASSQIKLLNHVSSAPRIGDRVRCRSHRISGRVILGRRNAEVALPRSRPAKSATSWPLLEWCGLRARGCSRTAKDFIWALREDASRTHNFASLHLHEKKNMPRCQAAECGLAAA